MKKYDKGQYGYRNHHKKAETGKVAFGAAMIIVQLAARNFVDSTAWKNILTVMAILSVLPTANVASPLLAGWRYKTPSEDFHRRVAGYEGCFSILYDLIITTRDTIIPADAAIVHPGGVFLYCTAPKLDTAKAEKCLKEIFADHKLDSGVKIILDEKAFFHRLESLKPAKEYEDDGSVDYTLRLLKNLSM
ncbi:putative uncharacterized protein [Hungatella hathewayi CAG:224]|nr:putative uncharacterized protein [Hungatella hathewayi CAG:224]